MSSIHRARALTLLVPSIGALLLVRPPTAQAGEAAGAAPAPPATYAALPNKTPARFEPSTESFDYIKRNPQTFIPNIFWARPGDYRKAVQRIYHGPGRASSIELPLVTTP